MEADKYSIRRVSPALAWGVSVAVELLAAGLRLLIVGVLYAARRRKVVGTIALSGRSWWSLEVAESVGESSWMSFGDIESFGGKGSVVL